MKRDQIWQTLEQLASTASQQSLSSYFAQDPQRVEKFSLQIDQLYADFSKNFLNDEIMTHLLALAESSEVKTAISRLLQGSEVNVTEQRPALHTALRQHPNSTLEVKGQDIMPFVLSEKEKMYSIVHAMHTTWQGVTGKRITDVVNLGIGGSDLGPRMCVEALKDYQQSNLKLHFVSNIDPTVIKDVLKQVNPETTVFIISSKSFNTPETLTNAQVAKQWLIENLKTADLQQHFIAVTANNAKAQAFGVAPKNILTFGEWVGGRYSIWSTIGLPLALSIGQDNFEAFLSGARTMDEHFAHAPLAENLPVVLALIGIWYINFWQANTVAVLPYTERLSKLPDYLQQLDMESNGKSVQVSSETVSYATGPIIWGQAGTNGQHAFYQLLHQGTHLIPIDFIALAQSPTDLTEQHQHLLANCFAQSAALMEGCQGQQAHEYMPGNKPSNTLLLNALTPKAMGELLALYEHKVYVQGVIWQINSFDQPGVELGKKLANILLKGITEGEFAQQVDPSTQKLIHKIRSS